ncbi:MAG: extracellular solute-binding protein [Bacteroidota bacterium]
MKANLGHILVCTIAIFIAGCAGNGPGKEKLVIYSPHGKELLSDFEKQFEAKNPGVDIQWMDMGSQEILDRVTTESRNSHADIWWGAPATIFMRAEKRGVLEQYKPSWAAAVPAGARSHHDYWYGTFATPEVIAFNDKKLTPATAPQDWDEIVSPAWKGKVVMRNPLASGTLRAIFAAMLARSVEQTGNDAQGWEWLRKLDANTDIYAADPTQMYTKLGGNDPIVTLWNMPDIVLQKKKNNYSFGYVFPKNGTIVLTDGIAIIKGTKHRELATRFYEFVTTKEALIAQAEKYYRIPARTDIPKELLPEWIRSITYTEMKVNWDIVAQNEVVWMRKWDTEIKSKK